MESHHNFTSNSKVVYEKPSMQVCQSDGKSELPIYIKNGDLFRRYRDHSGQIHFEFLFLRRFKWIENEKRVKLI